VRWAANPVAARLSPPVPSSYQGNQVVDPTSTAIIKVETVPAYTKLILEYIVCTGCIVSKHKNASTVCRLSYDKLVWLTA